MNPRPMLAALLFSLVSVASATGAFAQDGGVATSPAVAPVVGVKPTVAIAPFDTDRTGWVPPPRFGETVSDLLANRLIELGAFRIFDSGLLPESDLRGRRASLDAIRELASQAGVDYVILGAVTRFGNEKNHSRGGLLGIPFLGGAGKNSQESSVGLTLRVVNVRTGEVVTSTMSTGTATKKTRTIAGGALIHGVPVGGLFSSGGTGALDRLVAEALVQAVDSAATALAKAAGKIGG